MDKFIAHTGVVDMKTFEEWLLMRREEMLRMQAKMALEENEKDELFEWVVAHNAAFGEVLANFRKAVSRVSQ